MSIRTKNHFVFLITFKKSIRTAFSVIRHCNFYANAGQKYRRLVNIKYIFIKLHYIQYSRRVVIHFLPAAKKDSFGLV